MSKKFQIGCKECANFHLSNASCGWMYEIPPSKCWCGNCDCAKHHLITKQQEGKAND